MNDLTNKDEKEVAKVNQENEKYVERRNSKLINLILGYAIENHMSLQEIDRGLEVSIDFLVNTKEE